MEVLARLDQRLQRIEDNQAVFKGALQEVNQKLDGTLSGIIESVEFLTNKMADLETDLKQTKGDVSQLKKVSGMVHLLKQQNRVLHEKALSAENYSRMDNLIITGLQEI